MFSDEDSPTRLCIIRGPEDCVEQAKSLVTAAVENIQSCSYSKELTVPNDYVGSVIGNKGYFIKDVSNNIGVKINVDRKDPNGNKKGENQS